MVGKNSLSRIAWGLTLATGVAAAGCSGDDSSQSSPYTPFDSGTVVVPEAGAQPASSITLKLQGQGSVESSDVQPLDGGLVGQVVCTDSSSSCKARQYTTLYAIPANGWVFSNWTSTGLSAGVDLGDGSTAYTVTTATPNPLIAVFIPQFGDDAGTTAAKTNDGG